MESKKELRKLISMRKKQVPLEERAAFPESSEYSVLLGNAG